RSRLSGLASGDRPGRGDEGRRALGARGRRRIGHLRGAGARDGCRDRGEGQGDKPTNIASRIHFHRGDAEAGFAAADVIIEHTYRIGLVHQSYMEPRAAIATWDAQDHLTVYVSAQGQFFVRSELAAILGMPESRIKVVPMEIGGGFGAKIQPIVEPLTA